MGPEHMYRALVALLWRSTVVRLVVFSYCLHRWPGHVWLATKGTPLMRGLRDLALAQGRFDDASVCASVLRQAGEL